jgi:hypothetical protein
VAEEIDFDERFVIFHVIATRKRTQEETQDQAGVGIITPDAR